MLKVRSNASMPMERAWRRHQTHQDRGRSIPPLALFSSRRQPFFILGRQFANSKDDRLSGIYACSLEGKKERKLVVLCHSSFGFDAHNLFYADEQRQLVSVAFDRAARTISGSPSWSRILVGFQPSTYWSAFTVAQNGTLIYNTDVGAAQSALTWMDRSGKELSVSGDPTIMANPTLSPDGSRVAVDISDEKANNVDIWIENAAGMGNSRFTFEPSEEVVAVWSRDGRKLAYRNADAEGPTLLLKPATGLEREDKRFVLPASSMDDVIPNSWSLGDQQILFTHQVTSGEYLE